MKTSSFRNGTFATQGRHASAKAPACDKGCKQKCNWAAVMAAAPLVSMFAGGVAATSIIGTPGDGIPDFVYNPTNGDLSFSFDGMVPLRYEGTLSIVSILDVRSASGQFLSGGLTSSFKSFPYFHASGTQLYGASLTFSPVFNDGFDLGNVLPTGLTTLSLSKDLTLNYTVYASGFFGLSTANLISGTGGGTVDVGPGGGPIERGKTFIFTGPSANWSDGSNWSTGTLPSNAANVFLNSSATNPGVHLDLTITANSVANLTINGTGGASATLDLSQYNLGISANEVVGAAGAGSVAQSGGTHSVGIGLTLAQVTGSTGSYTLSNGNLKVGGNLVVGAAGTATFAQTGGGNSIGHSLSIGSGTGSAGIYTLAAGSLAVGTNLVVGDNGSGTLIQSGGSNSIRNSLTLGNGIGSTGTYLLSDGTLSVPTETIGASGIGVFNQSGGTHHLNYNVNTALSIGKGSTYNLSNGSLSVSGDEAIAGTFNQSGGTHTINASSASALVASTGTYTLSNGLLSVNRSESISGAFNQTGGIHAINSTAIAALSIANRASYALSDGSLSVTGGEYLSSGANFRQSGGNQIIGGDIQIGGSFNFSGGSLSAGSLHINTYSGVVLLSGAGTRLLDTSVDNAGTIQVAGTTAVYTGTFNNHSKYLSQKSDNFFQTLQISDGGNFTAGVGDRFFINGDFISSAEFHTVPLPAKPFNTTGAEIHFAGGGVHQYFTTPGSGIFSSVIIDPADSLNLLSGSIAQNVVNHGTLTVTSGSASLSNLTGDGNLMLGNASGSQSGILIAPAVTQGNVVIGNNSALRLSQGTQSTTSTLASLLINGSGKVDLANNSLILNSGTNSTLLAAVRPWLASGRNGGKWNGPGINSAFVARDPLHYSIGYADGAAGVVGRLTAGQLLIRPALIGDVTLSGKVDSSSINQIIARGHFNDGTTNNGWIDGDFNLDGKVNSADMQLITLSGNYKGTLPFAAPSASTAPATGVPSISYDPATGDVTLLTHGTAGIGDLHLLSASQQFNSGHTAFTSFVTATPGELESTLFDGNFIDGYDLGRILPTGLSSAAIQADVTLMYSTVGGATEQVANTPEPGMIGFAGILATSFIRRRRRTA